MKKIKRISGMSREEKKEEKSNRLEWGISQMECKKSFTTTSRMMWPLLLPGVYLYGGELMPTTILQLGCTSFSHTPSAINISSWKIVQGKAGSSAEPIMFMSQLGVSACQLQAVEQVFFLKCKVVFFRLGFNLIYHHHPTASSGFNTIMVLPDAQPVSRFFGRECFSRCFLVLYNHHDAVRLLAKLSQETQFFDHDLHSKCKCSRCTCQRSLMSSLQHVHIAFTLGLVHNTHMTAVLVFFFPCTLSPVGLIIHVIKKKMYLFGWTIVNFTEENNVHWLVSYNEISSLSDMLDGYELKMVASSSLNLERMRKFISCDAVDKVGGKAPIVRVQPRAVGSNTTSKSGREKK
ncbi:hypothetical protein VP01_1659g3 [Puccinia sorghi]|uniref:Uncharacterized protein n=1 Tax=Puccinia sorghi TaxID=27349 RepID=A0A0L6VGX0_9BASI|nr:hypothetical protein VP01_1659g3 [Puccinia sorghi]